MRFEIEHRTRYRYSVPVRLGEHRLRFLPLHTARQRPVDCRVDIAPRPEGVTEGLDAWGNRIQTVTFGGQTDHLEIRARLLVDTGKTETAGKARRAGEAFRGDALDTGGQAPYLHPLEDVERLRPFLDPVRDAAGGDAEAFLETLNGAIHALHHHGVRLEGPPQSPAETLRRGDGVCRDLAVLFMACCRATGLPTRFVSGYQSGDESRMQRYLHAWAEVLLPGPCWRGYDPTHGEPVGPGHVAVAAAPDPGDVTPVEGGYTFEGPSVTSTLDVDIHITAR